MKHNKGGITIDVLSTIAGLIFAAYAFLPQNTLNKLEHSISDLFSPTEQVIEYDGKN